jgi:hypothetical protein
MADRGFGYQALAGTPQPAFGTTLASATVLTADRYTGNTDPRSAPSQSTTTVGTGFKFFFQKNDRVMVGPANGLGPWDSGIITTVNNSTGALTIKGLVTTHASGEWIILCVACAVLSIQPGGANAGSIYIGPDITVGALSPTLFREINTSYGPYELGLSASGNVWETQGYWLNGTAADTFLAGIVTI